MGPRRGPGSSEEDDARGPLAGTRLTIGRMARWRNREGGSMKNLSTTVAVYAELEAAEADWELVESAARSGAIDLADATLVQRRADGTTVDVQRQSHHGWGKG